MKKIMYIAAALLVLVGCQKSQEAKENAPVNYGTITGKIELPQGPNKIAAREGWEEAETDFTMVWEEGDKIYIINYETEEYKLLTLKSIDEQTGFATFEGELLSDMNEMYGVTYGFNPIEIKEKTSFNVPYVEGNYHPFAVGYGTGESFSIETFHTVLGLPLKGTDALTKIEIIIELNQGTFTNTMNFESPLQLLSTPQTIYFPTMSKGESHKALTFNFYNAEGLIMTKTVNNVSYGMRQVVTFESELEVKAAPAEKYVDLGLSVNWATYNVGATKPEEYGDHFAWGETEPYYSSLSPLEWKTGKESGYAWQSYCGQQSFTEWSPAPFDATTKILKPEYDAAAVNWGGAWRMPTGAEFQELLDNCTSVWTDNYNSTGVKGRIFTSKKEGYTDKSIFLPANGYFLNKKSGHVNSYGHYWSSSLDSSFSTSYGRFLSVPEIDANLSMASNSRFYGRAIRPVCPKGE